MKKNVLALSITAALVGLTGGAHAMQGALGGADATVLRLNGDGVGHSLIIPYFTTQDNNSTLINLVNTDTLNGKAVKVRFRGASNSDDIFDFQVFLSPGDVWTANVSRGADGASRLTTNDASCTKPAKAVINATPFVTARLDTTLTAAQKANGTREGYVEIFNMADIPPLNAGIAAVFDLPAATTAGFQPAASGTANPLFTAIKHVTKVAPCSGTAWTNLDSNNLIYAQSATFPANANAGNNTNTAADTPRSHGMLPPSTGLMANWTIINVVGASAWTGEAVAVEARVVATTPAVAGAAARANVGNVVYWPQTATPVDLVDTTVSTTFGAQTWTAPTGTFEQDFYTADAILRSGNVTAPLTATTYALDASPGVTAAFYDLPDMSTPYTLASLTGGTVVTDAVYTQTGPLKQAGALTAALAAKSAINEFLTDTAISASTDWVFSMPTRRYSTALDYLATVTATDNGRRFTDLAGGEPTGAYPANQTAVATIGTYVAAYFNLTNTNVSSTTNGNGRQICVFKTGVGLAGMNVNPTDREETTPTAAAVGVVISPSNPAAPTALNFCGEATVLSINNGGILAAGTGALKASVAVQDLDVTYRDGWMSISTPAADATKGLPVMGYAFSRAFNGAQSFGQTFEHRFTR